MSYLLSKLHLLMRPSKKWIISLLIILVLTAVTVCFSLYISSLKEYIEDTAEQTLCRLSYRFDPELQWEGDGFYTPETWSDFNSDGSMDRFDTPTYVDRGFFDDIGRSEYLKSYGLGFVLSADNPLNVSREALNEEEQKIFDRRPELFTDNLIVGIDFGDFQRMCCGYRYTGSGFLELTITNGREHGRGECLICESTAEKLGYKLGDTITLKGENDVSAELAISGFFTYSVDRRPEEACQDFEGLGLRYSNPYFRIDNQVMKYMVIADFDSVYRLVPDGQREINSYIAGFELDDYTKYDEFVKSLDITHENRDFMKFVPDYITYNVRTEAVFNGLSVMEKFTLALTAVTFIIIFLLTLYIYREDIRETGILYSVGVKKTDLTLCSAAENIVRLMIVSLFSVCTGYLLSKIILFSNAYFSSLNLTFRITPEISCLLGMFIISGGIFSVLASLVFLSGRTPAELFRRD